MQSAGIDMDDMKSTLTAAKSSRNVPIDIADPTTPGVNVDGKYDTRKPVDHDSAAPERGEQFAPHRRAMPELRRREPRRSSAQAFLGLRQARRACVSLKVFLFRFFAR